MRSDEIAMSYSSLAEANLPDSRLFRYRNTCQGSLGIGRPITGIEYLRMVEVTSLSAAT